MKSKYKLKIKEISMRLKSSLFLLLGVVCLLALGQMVQANTWTDPTCAAPLCNTDGPVWVNPSTAQTGFVDLTYSNTDGAKPVINIIDTRTTTQPSASLYVSSSVAGAPAIQGSNTSATSATAYGGYFSANAAPGLYVTSGVVVEPLASNPTYVAEGLLYLNSSTNQFRYYGGGAWRILNPWLTDGNELYYSVAAGTQRGVAIKSGDLTGPNDNYTLDVVRESQSTSDRALYSRLTISPSWDYYASGFIGGYDDSGNAIGVRGKVSAHMGGSMLNYGGYFEAAGGTGSAGVYGLASAGGASQNYGGYFQANGSSGVGVYATGPSSGVYAIGGTVGVDAEGDTAVYGYGQSYGAQFRTDSAVSDGAIGVLAISSSSTNGIGVYAEGTHAVHGNSGFSNGRGVYGQHGSAAVGYGGYFTSSGSSGVGVYAAGPSTPTATAYAAKFDNGAIAMEELGTNPTWDTNYGMLYVKSDGKLWFTDSDTGASYDLTSGVGASGNIADGTVTGQVTYWNNTAGEWQSVASTDMLWDNTNKNLGIGVSPTAANKLHVVTNAASGDPVGVYASATSSGIGVPSTGVYGSATATSTGLAKGGYFIATGGAEPVGVYGQGAIGGWFRSNDIGGEGVYGYSSDTSGGYGGHFVAEAVGSSSAGVRASGKSKGVWGSATGEDGVIGAGGYFTTSCQGNGCYGVYGETTAGSIGVYGYSSASGSSVDGYGGVFVSDGDMGVGVNGSATATGAVTNYGGYFTAAGNTGRAVYGYSTATGAVTNYGGYFTAAGNTGRAVYGESNATTGINYGGYFYSASNTGRAVYGQVSSASTGTSYAGYFTTNTSTGYGIYANATNTGSYTNYGGYFTASGTSGRGVYASAPSYGVYATSTGSSGIAVAGYSSGGASAYGGYFQNVGGPAAAFDRTFNDGVVVSIRQAGTQEGTITVSGSTVSYTAFTGSHYAWPSQDIDRGYLVSFNNDNKYLNGNEKSEVIYGVNLTNKANSKDVLGAYLSIQTPKEELSVENPALVMAVGNGDMWVADNGSNLEVGDYLISSDVSGHAMKVTDEYPVAYVVARVAENVDWSKVEEKTEDGIKHKKISVLFESFILNQDLGLAFDKNQNLDDLSWFYAMEAKTPVEKAIQTQKQQLDALETKVERMESEGCANTDAELMEYIKKLEARVEALEAEKTEPVKTSFWSKLW